MCNLSSLYAGHDILRHEILLWAAWISCLGHGPAELFMQSLTSDAQDTVKFLIWSKHCLATTKAAVCYQHFSHTKSKHHCISYKKENILCSQTKMGQPILVQNKNKGAANPLALAIV